MWYADPPTLVIPASGVRPRDEAEAIRRATGADAVMSATGLLANPRLFAKEDELRVPSYVPGRDARAADGPSSEERSGGGLVDSSDGSDEVAVATAGSDGGGGTQRRPTRWQRRLTKQAASSAYHAALSPEERASAGGACVLAVEYLLLAEAWPTGDPRIEREHLRHLLRPLLKDRKDCVDLWQFVGHKVGLATHWQMREYIRHVASRLGLPHPDRGEGEAGERVHAGAEETEEGEEKRGVGEGGSRLPLLLLPFPSPVLSLGEIKRGP